MDSDVVELLKNIFAASVTAVQPKQLFGDIVDVEDGGLVRIGDKEVDSASTNFHVVGFGKAVLGMAVELDSKLKGRIKSGVLSIPEGSLLDGVEESFLQKFEIIQGAKDNQADENSARAAGRIIDYINNLQGADVLFILISGGGSALLPAPIPPLSLKEKQSLIGKLSAKGADIKELNTVRKRMSLLKGGGLAELSKASQTFCFILSDVIGDPLDFIASGPTVPNRDDPHQAWKILEKYSLTEEVSGAAQEILLRAPAHSSTTFEHLNNILVGSNTIALEAAKRYCQGLGCFAFILSSTIQGEAREVGEYFAQLAHTLARVCASGVRHEFVNQLSENLDNLGVSPAMGCTLEKMALKASAQKKDFCLIGGGETVVKVTGHGKGGRNQEMSLAFALQSSYLQPVEGIDLYFLSAGTDGIDGPTDAAGAISYPSLIADARCQTLQPEDYLERNDSYTFYRNLRNGECHVVTGHTGTNVMDVHVVLLHWNK